MRQPTRTAGAAGGWVEAPDGRTSKWTAAPLPGPPVDAYGAGDSFAAGLTFGLADGRSPQDALALGARCGAACVSSSVSSTVDPSARSTTATGTCPSRASSMPTTAAARTAGWRSSARRTVSGCTLSPPRRIV